MLSTTVMVSEAQRFDMVGKRLPVGLFATPERMSTGIAKRLHAYAMQRLDEAGFKTMIVNWLVEVYTLDGDVKPSERSYNVRFENDKRGYVEVVGIQTRGGWPTLDFGFAIGSN